MGVLASVAAAGLIAGGATAQTVPEDKAVPDNTGLNLPANPTIFGKFDPNIRKPTAIVNDAVITGTDVDQRVALIVAANEIKLSSEERDRLKLQILRQLIDETLEIQEAKAHDITATDDEIAQSFDRLSRNFGKTPEQMRKYLRDVGSSERSLHHQIEAELAWSRYLRRRVAPNVNVGKEEVDAIIDRLKANKGTEEYHVKEIYISATPDRAQQVVAQMHAMIEDMRSGKHNFDYFAQYSEASSRATNGDLDWLSQSQLAQLPDNEVKAIEEMQPGQVAGPVDIPGGFVLVVLVDKRKVLGADPRDAKLNLRQLTIKFPDNIPQAQADARTSAFAKAIQTIKGCGDVTKVAASIGADVVDSDTVKIRDLPAQLQQMVAAMQVGQATPPFGSVAEGVRSLVLCGRDDAGEAELPSAEQVQEQVEQQRVNLRANHILRDLRRDAIVEYR